MSVQIIEMNGTAAFAVVPMSEWQALLARLEEAQDIQDARRAQNMESFPAEIADRLLAGESPLKVWREYRGMSLQVLGSRCGVTRQMLSMIENKKANPSSDLLAKIAHALRCDLDDIYG